MPFLYRDFVRSLSDRVAQSLSTIETEHNFEYGTEFEIAMCEALRSALPDKFGITRGYVVDEDGKAAGDDIVIFERTRFPTIALRNRDDYARKEFVPIEAAGCYIEAKHTLHLEGDGPQSLIHACKQIEDVKKRVSLRPPVNPGQILPYFDVGAENAQIPASFPEILNPMYGVLFARRVRRNQNTPLLTDGQEIEKAVSGIQFAASPDLMVLGENVVVIPAVGKPKVPGFFEVRSPFCLPMSTLHSKVVDGVAYGIAFCLIMFALDWIQLGVLPWHKLIVDALGIPP